MKKLDEMFPREIVKELDRYIIGQDEAKKMIAIAIRNRARRKMLPDVIREEINPKNIMMIGPTGVGKTEIARRIAKLANAPFIKIEATKYTEVGYVGRDVESMVRDLMATSIQMVRDEMAKSKEDEVSERVNNRLVDLLLPTVSAGANQMEESITQTRDKFKELLLNGVFEDKEVEMRVNPSTRVEIGVMGNGNMTDDIQEAMSSLSSLFQKPKTRKVTIKRAREIIKEEEMDKAVDPEKAIDEAKIRCEEMGIIFIDEIHNLSRKLTEIFHTALENRTITIKSRNFQKGTIEPVRCWLPYFTLIGATNYLGSLSKPFRDRFQITLSFEIYSDEDIKTLIKNKSQKYYKVKISNEAIEYLSTKSRGVPRIALSFLAKAYDISVVREKTNNVKRITLEDVKKMFDIEQIDEFGLTRLDRKALGYLVTSSRPIGLKSLAQAIDEDVQTVENIIEPYLVKIGFVIRTGSGRFITDKGKDYLDRDAPDILHPVTPNFKED